MRGEDKYLHFLNSAVGKELVRRSFVRALPQAVQVLLRRVNTEKYTFEELRAEALSLERELPAEVVEEFAAVEGKDIGRRKYSRQKLCRTDRQREWQRYQGKRRSRKGCVCDAAGRSQIRRISAGY